LDTIPPNHGNLLNPSELSPQSQRRRTADDLDRPTLELLEVKEEQKAGHGSNIHLDGSKTWKPSTKPSRSALPTCTQHVRPKVDDRIVRFNSNKQVKLILTNGNLKTSPSEKLNKKETSNNTLTDNPTKTPNKEEEKAKKEESLKKANITKQLGKVDPFPPTKPRSSSIDMIQGCAWWRT